MYLLDFVLADDIRDELGNKFSLMGIYGDDIIFDVNQEFPLSIRLGLYIRVKLEPEDIRPDSFLVKFAMHEKILGEGKGVIDLNADIDKFALKIPIPGLPILQEGKLSIVVNFLHSEKPIFECQYSIDIRKK